MAEEKKGQIWKGIVYYMSAESDPKRQMYIGSTLQTIANRKDDHVYRYKQTPGALTAHVIMAFSDWDMTIIEEYDLVGTRAQAVRELRQYEQRWLDIFKEDVINKNRANNDRLQFKAYQRAYYKLNKEIRAAKRKVYRATNKEKEKAYYEANKERILARVKKWREQHPEKVKAYEIVHEAKRKRKRESD